MPGLKNNNNPELDYERIRLLFDYVRFGYIGMATAVCFLYLVVARYSSVEAARLWVAAMVVSYLPRIVVSLRFARRMRRRQISPANVGPWENYLSLSSIAPYLCFVAVIFLPYGDDAVVGTLLCAFAFMTMVAGGVLALSTSLASILLFMNLAMLSIIARFISLGDPAFVALAALVFLAYLQLSNLVFRQNRTLVENIALNIANSRSALIDPLTQLWNRRRLDLHIEKLLPT